MHNVHCACLFLYIVQEEIFLVFICPCNTCVYNYLNFEIKNMSTTYITGVDYRFTKGLLHVYKVSSTCLPYVYYMPGKCMLHVQQVSATCLTGAHAVSATCLIVVYYMSTRYLLQYVYQVSTTFICLPGVYYRICLLDFYFMATRCLLHVYQVSVLCKQGDSPLPVLKNFPLVFEKP